MDVVEDAMQGSQTATRQGEWLALGALLLPWLILSLLLPLPHMIAALSMIVALSVLLTCAVRWSRGRAEALALDVEAWGLAAVLSMGFSMALLLGVNGRSAFQALCHDCGRMSDARAPFCYACGTVA